MGQWIDPVDTGLPGHYAILAAVDRHYRHFQRDALPVRHDGFDLVHVKAAFPVGGGRGGVLGSANDRRAQRDHLPDQVGAFPRRLPSDVSPQAPAHQAEGLAGLPGPGLGLLEDPGQQPAHVTMVAAQSPTAHVIAEKLQVAPDRPGRPVARAKSWQDQHGLTGTFRPGCEAGRLEHQAQRLEQSANLGKQQCLRRRSRGWFSGKRLLAWRHDDALVSPSSAPEVSGSRLVCARTSAASRSQASSVVWPRVA